MDSCINDQEGYLSFTSIMKTLDKNNDDKISYDEGKKGLEVGSGRMFNGLMENQEGISMDITVLWERWVKSDG